MGNTIITSESFNSETIYKIDKNLLGFTSTTATDRKYEPQTQNTFSFQFLFDRGQAAYLGAAANMQANELAGAKKDEFKVKEYSACLKQLNEVLNMSLQGLTSPTKTIGQIVIDFFNSQIKYAGKPTYSNANITFNTFIGLGTKNVLSAWSNICQNEETLEGGWARSLDPDNIDISGYNPDNPQKFLTDIFPKIGYKVDGYLLECARDGTIVNSWKYIGMWVSSFTPGTFTMAGANSPSQVTATITVDKIMQDNTNTILKSGNPLRQY